MIVLSIVIFLCTVTMLISICIGLVLFKGYTVIKDYKKKEEDLTCLHAKIKELENDMIQQLKNNSINHHNSTLNPKYDLPPPTIMNDNKIYSQQEFSREINSGKFEMSSMLQSKLNQKK